jgi:hypothetical protein
MFIYFSRKQAKNWRFAGQISSLSLMSMAGESDRVG